ncbi:FecR domain-containing protein [Herbaspirillum camelliae]|uniref:FecR domain-containing protein n=1 Tax=Herbaspirillum camelliae TaxID=1892903 RepID=UPI000AE23ED9|nr:FecR domain-containing protein [Herbaspirillum camelliae]
MSISSKFEGMPSSLNARAASQAVATIGNKRRQSLKLLGVLSSIGLVGVLAFRNRYASSLLAEYRTSVGEQRQLTLADGTELWLNTETAIDVDYGRAERRITLRSGEILVKTAADTLSPSRPFLVVTDQGALHPLGTQFTVRTESTSSNIAVFEGAVKVSLKRNRTASQVVPAGLQMFFSNTSAGNLTPAETLRRDWIHGALTADDMRLEDFINELSRYHPGILSCSPDVANLRIVGSYPIQNMPAILEALEGSLPITVKQYTPWWTSISKKSA